MNVVDWVVIAAAALFAFLGWRSGFVRSLLGLAGFVAGVVAGVALVPDLVSTWDLQNPLRAVVVVGLVLIAAVLGQLIGSMIGSRVRGWLKWQPARWLDSTLGVGLALLGLTAIVWVLSTALLWLPTNPATASLKSSSLLDVIDTRVPGGAKQALYDVESRIQDATLPVIAGGFYTPPDKNPPPSNTEAVTVGISKVLDSVVKVSGNKPACGTGATGSGYVSTPEHVTTNAHVVAGMVSPRITTKSGRSYGAVVVAIDPAVDVAVLYVPDLPLEPVPTSTEAGAGTKGAFAGYPGGGDLSVGGAVVRAQVSGRQSLGEDIYGNPGQPREVLVLTARVVPGNSGGPLFDSTGNVIGLVFAQALEDSNVGYALSAGQFRTLSRQYATATASVDTGACPKA